MTPWLVWPQPARELDETGLRELYTPDRARPGLRVNFVSSVDGAVTVDGHAAGLSDEVDHAVLGLLRGHCDALLVGAGTVRQEQYRPVNLSQARRDWRVAQGLPPVPTLVIVSSALALDPAAPVLAQAPVRPIILTHLGSSERQREALADVADVRCFGTDTVDLAAAVADLHASGYQHLLSEGGPHLFGSLLAAGVVDELCLTVSAQLTGVGAGRIVDGPTIAAPQSMALRHVIAAGDTVLLRYARG